MSKSIIIETHLKEGMTLFLLIYSLVSHDAVIGL